MQHLILDLQSLLLNTLSEKKEKLPCDFTGESPLTQIRNNRKGAGNK